MALSTSLKGYDLVSTEEADQQLALYADLDPTTLTPHESKMLAIYDAIVVGTKFLDLGALLNRGQVRQLISFPEVALAPVGATEVHYTRKGKRPLRGRSRATFGYSADGWTFPLTPKTFSRHDPWEDSKLTATVPSILPTARDKVQDGDLIVFEPIWHTVSTQRRGNYDPAIIRHLNHDLYQVIAAWDLSPVEARLLG